MTTALKFAEITRRTGIALLLASMSGAGRATAQELLPRQKAPEFYLPFLRSIQAKVEAGGDAAAAYNELLAQAWAICGDETEAFRAWSRATKGEAPEPAPDLAAARQVPALEAILAAAPVADILFLNEAHHVSRCRAFAMQLLSSLKAIGYTHFAAEDLTLAGEALNDGAPVTSRTGLYANDPVYAEMLREARRLGFRLVSYDQTVEQELASEERGLDPQDARETAQAENLLKIRAAGPGYRIFAYCGFGHLSKRVSRSGRRLAAGHILAKSDARVISVHQVDGMPAPRPEQDPPLVAAVADRFRHSAPIAVSDADGKPLSTSAYRGGIDISVFHPRLPPEHDRPGWLAQLPGRRAVHFVLDAPFSGGLFQAVADRATGSSEMVPSDQYYAHEPQHDCWFYLSPGRYTVRLETVEGRRNVGRLHVV